MGAASQQMLLAAAAAGVTAAPWNSADKGASLTLSNSDYDVTQGTAGAYDFVRCLVGRNAGLKYFEILDVALNFSAAAPIKGFADTGASNPSTHYSANFGAGVRRAGGSAINELSSPGGWTKVWTGTPTGTAANGDKWMFAVNFTSGKAWVGLNGTWYNSGNPAAGTGEWLSGIAQTIYPAVSLYDLNAQCRLITAAGSLNYAPPSGFSAWEIN